MPVYKFTLPVAASTSGNAITIVDDSEVTVDTIPLGQTAGALSTVATVGSTVIVTSNLNLGTYRAEAMHDEAWLGVQYDAEGVLDVPASLQALPDTIAAVVRPRFDGHSLCAVGDSFPDYYRLNYGAGTGLETVRQSFVDRLALLSEGALRLDKNAAVSGRTSAAVLAGFDSELAAFSPVVLLDHEGTNDAANDVSLATFQANKLAILEKTKAKGGLPVWFTVAPNGMSRLGSPKGVTATASETGGTLGAGTKSYKVTFQNTNGESTATTVTAVIAGSTGKVTINVPYTAGMTGIRVYGRTSGSEVLMFEDASRHYGVRIIRTFTDTGSVTPSGASAPGSDTTARAYDADWGALTASYNAWMREYARENGIILLDFYELLAAPYSGMFLPGATADGIHPEPWHCDQMARMAWDALKPFTTKGTEKALRSPVEPGNLWVTAAHDPSVGHTLVGTTPTGATVEWLDSRPGFVGKVGHLVTTQPINLEWGSRTGSANLNTGFAVGDVIEYAVKVEIDTSKEGQVVIGARNGSTAVYMHTFEFLHAEKLEPTTLVGRFTVPASLPASIQFWATIPKGVAELWWGDIAFRNLTALGVA